MGVKGPQRGLVGYKPEYKPEAALRVLSRRPFGWDVIQDLDLVLGISRLGKRGEVGRHMQSRICGINNASATLIFAQNLIVWHGNPRETVKRSKASKNQPKEPAEKPIKSLLGQCVLIRGLPRKIKDVW